MALEQNRKSRLKAVCNLLRKHGANAMVLTHNIDQFYMSGFFFYPGESVFILSPKGLTCFTRTLYVEPFGKFAPDVKTVGCDDGQLAAALAYVKEKKLGKVGFDAAKEMYVSGQKMRQAGLIELPSVISKLREVKDEDELKKIRVACRIAYEAYEYIRPRVKTGMTESDVASLLENFMRSKGAAGTSFETIVAFGENSANPHHKTSMRKLQNDEAILLDYGCVYEGYMSDISRCWWHGKNEPAEYTKIWNLVNKARQTGIKTAQVKTATKNVDGAARGVIEAAGYGTYFTHRTGHGIGIEIHEEPCNSQTSAAILAAGNVFSVEPGIYLPGKFGVRLEDTVVATKKGPKIYTRK